MNEPPADKHHADEPAHQVEPVRRLVKLGMFGEPPADLFDDEQPEAPATPAAVVAPPVDAPAAAKAQPARNADGQQLRARLILGGRAVAIVVIFVAVVGTLVQNNLPGGGPAATTAALPSPSLAPASFVPPATARPSAVPSATPIATAQPTAAAPTASAPRPSATPAATLPPNGLPKNPQVAALALEEQSSCAGVARQVLVPAVLRAISPGLLRIEWGGQIDSGTLAADGTFDLAAPEPLDHWGGHLTTTGGTAVYETLTPTGCHATYQATLTFK